MKQDRPSGTSLVIAAGFVFSSRESGTLSLVPNASERVGEWVLRHYSWSTWVVGCCVRFGWFRGLIRQVERRSVPHITDHYVERKRSIEAALREWVGARRLVVLGAGFDTLAARWAAEDPARTGVEIDHPATQAWKRRALKGCGLEVAGLSFRAADFSRAGELSFDAEGAGETFWIAEGLLMYFPEAGVRDILRAVGVASRSGSRIAFTILEPDGEGRIGFRLPSRGLDRWLAKRREPFVWGIRRSEAAGFLDGLGFRQLGVSAEVTRGMDELGVGEYLVLAEVK